MKPIVTLTLNPAIDGASEADTVQPTRKVRTSNERYDPGGGGINAARVIKELGGPSLAVYLAGGVTGTALDRLLQARGIVLRRIEIADLTRVSHAVYERSTGLEYRFVPEGPEILPAEWRRCLAVLEETSFDYLIASGSLPRGVPSDFYVRASRIAQRKGARFVLDTSGAALRETLAAGGVHLVKPSSGELAQLAGRALPDADAQEEAAMASVRSGATELMAVTLGRDGSFLARRGGVLRQAPMPVTARSAVGAGDSFVAAMTYALARGRPPEEAFRWGTAAGTAAVLTPGTELCRRDDVERLFAQLQATPQIPAASS